jgi:hypothetical protein
MFKKKKDSIKDYKTMICFGDLHIPFHDKKLAQLILQIIDDIKPDIVVSGGDEINATCLSDFDKSIDQMGGLQAELDMAHEYLGKISEIVPKAEKVVLSSNHFAARLVKHIKKMHWLEDLVCIRPANLLRLNDIGWEYANGWSWKNRLMLVHGDDKAGSQVNPIGTVKQMAHASGMSIVRFHSHNHANQISNMGGNFVYAIQMGTIHDFGQIDYIKHPELIGWVHSMGLFYLNNNGHDFHFIPIVFINGKTIVNGKVYSI